MGCQRGVTRVSYPNNPPSLNILINHTCLSVWRELGHSMYLRHWCLTSPSMVHFDKKLQNRSECCGFFQKRTIIVFAKILRKYIFTSKNYLLSKAFDFYGRQKVRIRIRTRIRLFYFRHKLGP